jgi:hypothetical protein
METGSLRFSRDSLLDAAYIYLRYPLERGEVVRSDVLEIEATTRCSVICSLDEYDRLVSIKLLGASRLLPPELL